MMSLLLTGERAKNIIKANPHIERFVMLEGYAHYFAEAIDLQIERIYKFDEWAEANKL